MTALIFASLDGHTAIVQLLLGAGADKEAKDQFGYTALMSASEGGHTAIVELLLGAGADTVTVQLCYIYKENSLSSFPEHK